MFFIILLITLNVWCHAQGYISPFKYKDGNFVMKTQYEISQEESRASQLVIRKEYDKPTKNQSKGEGEIWIDGFCRYRPASYKYKSNFDEDVTEVGYQRESFSIETVTFSDGFKEKGNIPWSDNAFNENDRKACAGLLSRIESQYSDGIPFLLYDSIRRLSTFFDNIHTGKRTGRDYEFSRAVSIWLKRMKGPESMDLNLYAGFTFVNSTDHIDIKMNDKGKFTITAFCENDKPQLRKVASGKAKTWQTGGWNELTVKKDEFNNVLVYANDELILTYKIPTIPVATRFSGFYLSMPYQWEKKDLQYNIGRVTSFSYPKYK